MATTETINEVLRYTRYNSGSHFLDSGDAYGRHWQQAAPGGMFTASGEGFYGGVTLSLTHVLAEYWSIDQELQDTVDAVWEEYEDQPETEKTTVFGVTVDAWERFIEEMPELIELEDGMLTPAVRILGASRENVENCTFDVQIDGRRLGFWDVATAILLLRGYVREARDNAYNGENDLDQVFVWEVWTPAEESGGDWVWARGAKLVVYAHTGCDVRGGYARPMVLDCESSEPEYNLIEVRVGYWPADDVTREYCEDEGIEDHFSVGYTSCPSYDLESAMGEFIRWEQDGDTPIAVFANPNEGGPELRFAPDYNP